jgi:hypothetical protein
LCCTSSALCCTTNSLSSTKCFSKIKRLFPLIMEKGKAFQNMPARNLISFIRIEEINITVQKPPFLCMPCVPGWSCELICCKKKISIKNHVCRASLVGFVY